MGDGYLQATQGSALQATLSWWRPCWLWQGTQKGREDPGEAINHELARGPRRPARRPKSQSLIDLSMYKWPGRRP